MASVESQCCFSELACAWKIVCTNPVKGRKCFQKKKKRKDSALILDFSYAIAWMEMFSDEFCQVPREIFKITFNVMHPAAAVVQDEKVQTIPNIKKWT